MAVTFNIRADMFNQVQCVIEGVLAETMDKQAKRIAELEGQVRSNNQLEQRALRLSLKPRKIRRHERTK